MKILEITKENINSEIMGNEGVVLLDFWAAWCGPCRMLSPVIEEIASERPDVKIGKINVDSEPELSAEFGITSIPTLFVLKNGKVADKLIGYRPKQEILKSL